MGQTRVAILTCFNVVFSHIFLTGFHTNAIRIANSRYLHLNRFVFSVKQTRQQQIQFIDDFFNNQVN